MATIAQGMITLSSVNDAYSVSLSPSSCVINADYNGKNPKLTYAYSDIRVIRGETAVPFDKPKFLSATNNSGGDIIQIDETTWRVQFTSIPETDLSGSVQFEIKVGTDFQTVVTFAYTVVRETSMLDWILDWNGTYTEISGKWIITPKIFAGTKNANNEITGVYLGPAFDNSGSTGLYGYKDNEIIFQLTETGGTIGGWKIENGGIQTSDGVLKILSGGAIISAPDGVTAWELNKSGSATFAKGNVKFNVDGSAEFAGKITSPSGSIGGWLISTNQIRSHHIILDSDKHLIGINPDKFQRLDPTTGDTSFPDSPEKAIKFWYNTENDWGLAGWDASNKVFQLGSSNFIAGWNFDNVALWTGAKNNTARQNTASEGDITIGSAGLRGMNWYIDHDGEISFVNGLIHFDKNGGTISGWTLNPKRLNTKHAALISNESFCGLYLTLGDLSESADGSISQVVHSKGGIEIVATQYNAYIWAHESDGTASFYLSSLPEDVNWIGGWCFDGDAIFFGDKKLQEGQYTSLSCITLSPHGLRGTAWRFEADGSGAVAKGNIAWDKNGNVTFANSVKMAWSQITGTDDVMTAATYIDANGIFTGKISADNITAGTISTATIKSVDETWVLNNDGSGSLANGALTWEADGTTNWLGWVFKNNRLESQNGKIFLDGLNGSVKLAGTIQLSTGYHGEWEHVNLYYIPPFTGNRYVDLGYDSDDVGKVVRIFNSNPFGGASVIVYFYEFPIEGGRFVPDAGSASILPQETVEFTCFEIAENRAKWAITNRFGFDNFRQGTIGRFARMLTMGKITITSSGASIIGKHYEGKSINEFCSIERTAQGKCKITFNSNWKTPTYDYNVFLTGIGDSVTNAQVISKADKILEIGITRGNSFVDGTCEFMIQSGSWFYDINS